MHRKDKGPRVEYSSLMSHRPGYVLGSVRIREELLVNYRVVFGIREADWKASFEIGLSAGKEISSRAQFNSVWGWAVAGR